VIVPVFQGAEERRGEEAESGRTTRRGRKGDQGGKRDL
jgi:hypothetical protein